MEGTNISFPNEQVNAEFTFYGNGCRISTGSKVACETRQVSTYDNETQNNGTMYSIASAFTRYSTPGTTTDNSNSPDTFCPLGWQMPYGGTGGDYYDQSKSWRYLIETAYSLTKSEPGSQAINSYPISYVPGGGYELRSGVYYNQGAAGLYWTSTRNDGSRSYRYYIGSNTYIIEANSNGYGYALRCITRKKHPRKVFYFMRQPAGQTLPSKKSIHHEVCCRLVRQSHQSALARLQDLPQNHGLCLDMPGVKQ